MIKQKEQNLEEAGKALTVVRRLAGAFRQVAEFEQFVQGLEAALGKAEFFDRAAISLFPRLEAEGGLSFPASNLCLPLAGEERVLGMLSISNGSRELGAEDLHLMGGLAELVAAMTDHALRFGEQRKNLALLGFLLNQIPVGALCFDGEGRVIVSNNAGRRMLGIDTAEAAGWSLSEEWCREISLAEGEDFHRHVAGKLIQAAVRATSSGAGDEVRALILTDLTPEAQKFREALARECYRCAWKEKPVTLLLLHALDIGPLMAALPHLRERFSPLDVLGLMDERTIGILLPECGAMEAMERLRRARPLLRDEWEAGVSASGQGRNEPEVLVASAFANRRRAGDFLKRTLLLHDDYPSVNDMLEMVLRDEFKLVKSSDLSATLRHVRSGCFDGLFTEIDLSNGADGWELARIAREASPSLRPFFTSAAAMTRREEPRFRGEVVFQKPFSVAELREAVAAAFV